MKSKTKKLFFSFMLIFSLAKTFCQNSNYKNVFDFALNLEQNNCLKEASLEYKRYLFLEENFHADFYTSTSKESNETKEHALNFLSNYYIKLQDYDNAFLFNNMGLFLCQNSSCPDDLFYFRDINLIYLTQRRIYTDYRLLRYIIPDAFSPTVAAFAYIRIIKDAVQEEEFKTAEEYFNLAATSFPQFFDTHAQKLFSEGIAGINKFKPKNQHLASGLSIVPGLGQLYAGFPKDALNSFLLNGSLILISIYSIANMDFVDFGFLELNWVYRFYKGNIYNAAKDVRLYNSNKLETLSLPVYEVLDAVENRIKNQYILEHDKSTDF